MSGSALLLTPASEPKLLKSAAAESKPLELVKSPRTVVKSAPSVGSMLDRELMMGSRITSNASAWAGGAPASGLSPNAKNAPAPLPRPIVRRRRALSLPDRRLPFAEPRPAIAPRSPRHQLDKSQLTLREALSNVKEIGPKVPYSIRPIATAAMTPGCVGRRHPRAQLACRASRPRRP